MTPEPQNPCPLQVYLILDELVMAGEIAESSKKVGVAGLAREGAAAAGVVGTGRRGIVLARSLRPGPEVQGPEQ